MGGGPASEAESKESADPAPAANPERRALGREQLEIARRELDRCPPRAREVFRAAYSESAPDHAEIACEFGLSVQRVRQILCEVRARLRAAAGDFESEDERWHT